MNMPDKVYLNRYMIRPGMLRPAQIPADEPEFEYIRRLLELEEKHPAFAENVRDNAYCEAIADAKRIIERINETSLPSNLDFADIMDNMVDELVRKTSSAKEEHFKVAFEQTFGKPFDADKVYKKRLTRFIMQEDNTEYYSYCNRVFLIVRQNFDFGIENNTCSLSFEIPTKLYYTRKNGRVEFINKAKHKHIEK